MKGRILAMLLFVTSVAGAQVKIVTGPYMKLIDYDTTRMKPAVRLSAALSGAKTDRAGNTIYNLVDEKTGQIFSIFKVDGIASTEIDSVAYFRFGSETFERAEDPTALNFGVRVGDDTRLGDNNRIAYQKYLNWCSRRKRQMVIPDGVTVVHGRLDRTNVYTITGQSYNAVIKFMGDDDGFWWDPRVYAHNVLHQNYRVEMIANVDTRALHNRRSWENDKIGSTAHYFGANNTVIFQNVRGDFFGQPDDTTDYGTCFFYAAGQTYKLNIDYMEGRQCDYGAMVGWDEYSGRHNPRNVTAINTVTNRITTTGAQVSAEPLKDGDYVLLLYNENDGKNDSVKPRKQYVLKNTSGGSFSLVRPSGSNILPLVGLPVNMSVIPAATGGPLNDPNKPGTGDYANDEWSIKKLILATRQKVMSVGTLGGYSHFESLIGQRGHGASFSLLRPEFGPLWGGGGVTFGGLYDEGPFGYRQEGKITHLIETDGNVFASGFWLNKGEIALVSGNDNKIGNIVSGDGYYQFRISGNNNVVTGVYSEKVQNTGIANKLITIGGQGRATNLLPLVNDNAFAFDRYGGFTPDFLQDGLPDVQYLSNNILFYPMAHMLSGLNKQQNVMSGPDCPAGFSAYAYDAGPYKEVVLQYPKGENGNRWSSKYLPRTRVRAYVLAKNNRPGTVRLLLQGFGGVSQFDKPGTPVPMGNAWGVAYTDFDFTGAPEDFDAQFRVVNDGTADTVKVACIYFKPIPTETITRKIKLTDAIPTDTAVQPVGLNAAGELVRTNKGAGAGGDVTASGNFTAGRLPVATAGKTLQNSAVYFDGARMGINSVFPLATLHAQDQEAGAVFRSESAGNITPMVQFVDAANSPIAQFGVSQNRPNFYDNHITFISSNRPDGQIEFNTAGQRRAKIDQAGNWAIGLNNAEEKLHVAGGRIRADNFVITEKPVYDTALKVVLARDPVSHVLKETVVDGLATISDSGNVRVTKLPDGKSRLDFATGGNIRGGSLNYTDAYDTTSEGAGTLPPVSRIRQLSEQAAKQYGSVWSKNVGTNEISYNSGSVNINGNSFGTNGNANFSTIIFGSAHASGNGNDPISFNSGTALHLNAPAIRVIALPAGRTYVDASGFLKTTTDTSRVIASSVSGATAAGGNLLLEASADANKGTVTINGSAFSIQLNGSPILRNSTGVQGLVNLPYSTSGANTATFSLSGTLGASTGAQYGYTNIQTVNQTGQAGYNAIYASIYEQATGTGRKYLLNLGNSSSPGGAVHVRKFSVDNTGSLSALGTAVVGDTAAASTSAVLELRSTSKGFLPPRMSNTQNNAIASPAVALTVYNTTTLTYRVFTGTEWLDMVAGKVVSGTSEPANKYLETNINGTTYYIPISTTHP